MARLDPRSRLFLGGVCIGAILVASRLEVLAAQSALILILLLATRLAGKWWRAMRLLWATMVMVFVVVYLSFDIRQALVASAKLFNLLTVSFVFFNNISPQEMADALRKMHVPYGFSFILTTAMRYVPLIGQKTRNIMDAQMSRGIDLRFRPRNIKNIMALLVPLTVQSFMLSEQLGMAMEMRGFARAGRTVRRTYQLRLIDYLAIVVSSISLAMFTCWHIGWLW